MISFTFYNLNNQYVNWKINSYIRQSVVQLILDLQLWNVYY